MFKLIKVDGNRINPDYIINVTKGYTIHNPPGAPMVNPDGCTIHLAGGCFLINGQVLFPTVPVNLPQEEVEALVEKAKNFI